MKFLLLLGTICFVISFGAWYVDALAAVPETEAPGQPCRGWKCPGDRVRPSLDATQTPAVNGDTLCLSDCAGPTFRSDAAGYLWAMYVCGEGEGVIGIRRAL